MSLREEMFNKWVNDMPIEDFIELTRTLERIPKRELPRIYDELNTWQWPDELGHVPKNFAKIGEVCMEQEFFMRDIRKDCGLKALGRYNFVSNLGYTDQQFEDKWDDDLLNELLEIKEKLNQRHYSHNDCDNNRDNSGLFIKNVLFFVLGFLTGFLLSNLSF